MTSPGAVLDIIRPLFADAPEQESVVVVSLTRRLTVKGASVVFRGGPDSSVVDLPTVLRRVLLDGGVSFILAHNHPSGDPSPSEEDRNVTRKTAAAAGVVGLKLVDHVIIGGDGWHSFAAAGAL